MKQLPSQYPRTASGTSEVSLPGFSFKEFLLLVAKFGDIDGPKLHGISWAANSLNYGRPRVGFNRNHISDRIRVVAGKERVVDVLDTCVWQDLVDTKPRLLMKLMGLARRRVAFFGVPDVVRQEFSCNADGIDRKRAGWVEHVDALARLAKSLDLAAVHGGTSCERRACGLSVALAAMKAEIRLFPGFSEQDMVHTFLSSEQVIQIPKPVSLAVEILEWAKAKKKPYGEWTRDG